MRFWIGVLASLLVFPACDVKKSPSFHVSSVEFPRPSLRILLDQSPIGLHPRYATDGTGQRILALLYRGLTRLDQDLNPQPDLAVSWASSQDARIWRFVVNPDLVSPEDVVQCLESYRIGKPSSPLTAVFPSWRGTTREKGGNKNAIILKLSAPDVYLPRNIANLRFFKAPGAVAPCQEGPSGDLSLLAGNGSYEIAPESMPGSKGSLKLRSRDRKMPDLEFVFVEDHITRTLKLLRGEADLAFNSLPPAKAEWLKSNYSDLFQFVERPSVTVSYLGFNLRHPILKHAAVRKAIALAIDRESIVKMPLHGNLTPAGSLLAPSLMESFQSSFSFDPRLAMQLLDDAGFPLPSRGERFTLHYKTTPLREGMDTALVIREMLKRIGVQVEIEVMEPSVYFASLRKGNFDLFASRWLSVADGTVLFRALHTRYSANRAGYSDPTVDHWLEQALQTLDTARRTELLRNVQRKMAEDLPYFPLWYWKNQLVLRRNWKAPVPEMIPLNGAFGFLGLAIDRDSQYGLESKE